MKIKEIRWTTSVGICMVACGASAYGGITGSEHDFKNKSWNSSGEICIVCHTPHNADTTVTASPLWNHQVTTATHTLYSSSTLDASLGQLTGSSKLCLSCHDGTVAVDSFGGASGSDFMSPSDKNYLGTDLSDDHPIGFTYDTALATADGQLHNPSTTSSGLGGTIAQDMLFNGKLECASCHNVHDQSIGKFLTKGNVASALCLTCHNK